MSGGERKVDERKGRKGAKGERLDINTALVRAARAHRVAAASLLSEVGLHPGQEAVLIELWDRDGRTQTELAEAVAVEPPTITKMVQRMEATGLLRRRQDPNDRRAMRVYLTAKGRKLRERVDKLTAQLARASVAGLSDRQQSSLGSMLTKVTENLSGA